jgi:hypothetical protein
LLRRLYVLVFICIGSRRIEYIACTTNPDGAWMVQQARNLLMDLDDRGQRPQFLITTVTRSSARLQHHLPQPRDGDHQDADPCSKRERAHRALDR